MGARMNPTRREVLKALLVAPVAGLVPVRDLH